MRSFFASLATAIARHWGWLMAVLALAALVAGNHFIAAQAPRPAPKEEVVTVGANDPAARKLSAEVDALEKTFRAGMEAAVPDDATMAALDQAIQKQRQLVTMLASADSKQVARLHGLETEQENQRVQAKAARIGPLAAEGQRALDAGNFAEADPKLHEALRLQREVNASGAAAPYKNSARESQLARAVAAVEAEPLSRELADLLTAAHAAVPSQPAVALATLVKARNLQARLNRDYAGTRYANVTAVQELNAEIESLSAASLREESETAGHAGDAALAAGRATDAADFFATARDRQIEINQKFKRSALASVERADALEVKRQTAASIPTSELLAGLDQTITGLLRRRQPAEAAAKIAEAARMVGKHFATFPRSPRLDPALKEKLDYLAAHTGDLAEIQRLVDENLRPLPGVPALRLLKTELPQTLYTLVTGANPSRNAGAERPVDSVSWLDAQAFCQRLAWLLAAPVRLPTEAEFRAALGADGGSTAVWSHENSPDSTQPVSQQPANGAGFCDLLGNVAEWLAAGAAAAEATVAGGSYLDPQAALRRVPLEPRAKNDRARHIGFRFVFEPPALSVVTSAPVP